MNGKYYRIMNYSNSAVLAYSSEKTGGRQSVMLAQLKQT